jgi:hypothetical protein
MPLSHPIRSSIQKLKISFPHCMCVSIWWPTISAPHIVRSLPFVQSHIFAGKRDRCDWTIKFLAEWMKGGGRTMCRAEIVLFCICSRGPYPEQIKVCNWSSTRAPINIDPFMDTASRLRTLDLIDLLKSSEFVLVAAM